MCYNSLKLFNYFISEFYKLMSTNFRENLNQTEC